MGAFDLIARGAAQGAKKVAPFFSKVDEVLESLPRNKGTGDEFLREIEKTKGVKPAEIQDRGIAKALKGKPKMTKAEVKKIFESNPPPKVKEEIRGGYEYEEALDQKAKEIIGDEDVGFGDLYGRDRDMAEAAVQQDFGYNPETQYDTYKTPGGENYREILLKLPVAGENVKKLNEISMLMHGVPYTNLLADTSSMAKLRLAVKREYKKLYGESGKDAEDQAMYFSSHFKDTPNLLAHIRVQDFKTPDGKKVLLVDEIQSDWHQEGRKKGYRGDQKKIDWNDPAYVQARERAAELGNEFNMNNANPARQAEIEPMLREARMAERAFVDHNNRIGSLVPDAPFKKNWHELAMKRVLDYAAENGYDSIAITPGAEQAKRYNLSKQVDELLYKRNDDGTYQLSAQTGGYGRMLGESVDADKLEDYVGKEIAQKIVGGEGSKTEVAGKYDPASMTSSKEYMQSLSGIDLQVGGEGMKGFYDKILPDYLNNFGKQYGASVREAPMNYTPSAQRVEQGAQDDALLGQLGVDTPTVTPTQYHFFDITPQLREEVKSKGLPLYSKMAAPEGLAASSGAATIGSQVFDENNEQQVQNPVHFTENPDAMLLELMQRN